MTDLAPQVTKRVSGSVYARPPSGRQTTTLRPKLLRYLSLPVRDSSVQPESPKGSESRLNGNWVQSTGASLGGWHAPVPRTARFRYNAALPSVALRRLDDAPGPCVSPPWRSSPQPRDGLPLNPNGTCRFSAEGSHPNFTLISLKRHGAASRSICNVAAGAVRSGIFHRLELDTPQRQRYLLVSFSRTGTGVFAQFPDGAIKI